MPDANAVLVVPYAPRHAAAFRELNLAWIEEHFEVEPIDRQQLGSPEETILSRGGAILVAELNGVAVGVCALIAKRPGRYELSKMAVRTDLRGHGIGRKLLAAVIEEAGRMGASELFLISNTKLEPAIHLYRDLGFSQVPVPGDQEYARANISMEMKLG